jgi:hypothetical protein
MEKTPVRPKVSIHEHRLLIDSSKSKKLAAMANKSPAVLPRSSKTKIVPDCQSELQHAQQLIDARIHDIMNSFPQGRRNKLFSFRFGSIAAIHALEIKAAFKLLSIDSHNLNMRLLASLNYHGDTL